MTMNAGPSYDKALKQAKANAAWTGETRFVFSYGGVFWIESERPKATAYAEVQPDGTHKREGYS